MTKAQLRLANTGHAFSSILARVAGDRRCVNNVGVGVELVVLGGCMLSFARASTTRAKT